MSLRAAVDETHDLEDVRLAVVMNGGVSLAVWIGGVAYEMNRLTRASAGEAGTGLEQTYLDVLDITKSSVRIDVIAGTSAGGLNGAFLALATVLGRGLDALGPLWARSGAFTKLFRSPMERQPPSLMKGDDYFLEELRLAFKAVAGEPLGQPLSPGTAPMSLFITATMLQGETRMFQDDFGSVISELDHAGRLAFLRGGGVASDGFDDVEKVIAKLALASRSTASFPVAFEPSLVPVRQEAGANHPDMNGIANFGSTRYVIDGGVLMNKPVRPALEAVMRMSADRQVRRILAYVNPHPKAPDDPPPLPPGQALPDRPGPHRVLLDSLVTLPRAQSIHAELEEIDQHNKRVREHRRLRADIADVLTAMTRETLAGLYTTYRLVRVQRAVTHIADVVLGSQAVPGANGAAPAKAGAPTAESGAPAPAWTRGEVVAALLLMAGQPPEGVGADPAGGGPAFLPPGVSLEQASRESTEVWHWGIAPLERMTAMAIDLFGRAMTLAPLDNHPLREALRGARRDLHEGRESVAGLRAMDTAYWQGGDSRALLPTPPENSASRQDVLRFWAARALSAWPGSAGPEAGLAPNDQSERDLLREMAEMALRLASVLLEARPTLLDALEAAAAGRTTPAVESARFDALCRAVFGADAISLTAIDVVEHLLELEVALVTVGCFDGELEQEVQLLQVGGDTPNSLGAAADVEKKLAGVKLGHFGAFYKESWRVNDWIWGRLDGATRLVQAVLSPQRLRQLQLTTEQALGLVRDAAIGEMGPDQAALLELFPEPQCRQELLYLDDPAWPTPPSLPDCALAIARRIHVGILRAELPALRAAVRTDEADGAGKRGNGARFARAYDAAVTQEEQPAATVLLQLPPAQVLQLFADARLGEETFADELGTDLLANTVSTAAGVTTSVVDQPTLGPARALTKVLRGIVLTTYGLVRGATTPGNFGPNAVSAALAIGGALVAVSLLTPEPMPTLLVLIGTMLVLGGIVLAGLLHRRIVFAVLVGVPLGVILAILFARRAELDKLLLERWPEITVVTAIVLFMLLLGSVGARSKPPKRS